MRKFCIKISIFFLLLCLADLSFGFVFNLYPYVKGGSIQKVHSIMTKETPDILIIGSSRACHHYNPSLINDSLDFSSYNAGLDGLGTVVGYGFLKGISQRSYPKYIICEILPQFDLYDGYQNIGLEIFNPYYKVSDIEELMTLFDKTAKFKLLSNLYRLNGAVFDILGGIMNRYDKFQNGFFPLKNTIMPESKKKENYFKGSINLNKERILRQLIEESLCSKCKLIFTISPWFKGANLSNFEEEIKIINEYNLPLLNHLNDERIINNSKLFQDEAHLNIRGANEYTNIIITELKKLISDDFLDNQ